MVYRLFSEKTFNKKSRSLDRPLTVIKGENLCESRCCVMITAFFLLNYDFFSFHTAVLAGYHQGISAGC